MAPSNSAAFLIKPKTHPFAVKSTPYVPPNADQIVVKARAIAVNPIDYLLQDQGDIMFQWIKYPFILGSDVAGEVVEVGSDVTRFKVGDKILGHAVGEDKAFNTSAQKAFQEHVVLFEHMSSPIPASMDFDRAAVLPLAVSTAACGLFLKDFLALQMPKASSTERTSTGKTVIVWGGSTSVGLNAIQLAVAAGYEVLTTCSPRNFDLCKGVGAAQTFDYNSSTAKQDIVAAMKGKQCAGAITMGQGSAEACMDILQHCEGNKFIAMASFPLLATPPRYFVTVRTIFRFISWNVSMMAKGWWRGVSMKFINGTDHVQGGVGKAIYQDFLPSALADGSFVPKPDPQIFGHGLEKIQGACDLLKKGVSAKKVIVTL